MRISQVILLLGGALAAAAGQSASIKQPQPFSVLISPRTSEVKTGTGIELSVRLTNTSDHEINASSSWERGVDVSYEYEVRDGSGNLVA